MDLTIDKCVDIALSLKLSNGKTKLAEDLLRMLLTDLAQSRAAINHALDQRHLDEALELVHNLHGACCYCGVPQLKNTCYQLETKLRAKLAPPSSSEQVAFNSAVDALLNWQKQYEIKNAFVLEK